MFQEIRPGLSEIDGSKRVIGRGKFCFEHRRSINCLCARGERSSVEGKLDDKQERK